jgi:hypothetical protein
LHRLMQSMTKSPCLHMTAGNQWHSPLPPCLSFTSLFSSFFSRVSSTTHKIFPPMLSTMSRHRKLSNCSPRALLEVINAFNSATGHSLILLLNNLNHALHEKDDQEGDAAAAFSTLFVAGVIGSCLAFCHMIDSTDCELVCALLQLCLLFKWERGCMSLQHAAEAEGRRGLARRLACRHR